jgi:hypothetical protein
VRRMDPAAGALDRIEQYEKWIVAATDADTRRALQFKLLSLQAARGLVHKALPFLHPSDALCRDVRQLQDEHALHYGFDLTTYDMGSAKRGSSLGYYFSHHADALRGKRVLHFAPERELRPWMEDSSAKIGFTYFTADGFVKNVDYAVDLCALDLPDDAFDLVINHRVLEHIIDDGAALKEMHRILRPGGVLNISVPEAFYLARKSDWRVPDPRVYAHYRTYGRDFPLMLMKAGFTVERGDWLLKQPVSDLQAANAYPMLFYLATKT